MESARARQFSPRIERRGGLKCRRGEATAIMETEQLQNFNERLSQWVSNQGFWFQVRYSMSGKGMKGRAMFHLLRLGFRLLIFMLIAAVAGWVFLIKRTDTQRFSKSLQSGLQEGLSATDLEMRGFDRVQGQLEIGRLAAEGDKDTFFTTLEAKTIRCKMGLLDGLHGVWKPGIISIARLEVDLRAGSDDAESARSLSESIFRKSALVDVSAFEVAGVTLRWGYSERTQGSIENSALKMQRTETGWRLSFKGGTFSQNWLRQMDIVSLVVLCEPGGLVFEKAELKQRKGTVDFSGLRLIGGERPEVEGLVRVRNVVLEDILPAALRTFLEGSISGDFKVFGSTNTSDGIGFEGQVVMDGSDVVSLRERIHLLKALSVVDFSRNYHRIDFREGSFQMRTFRGGMELTDVQLKSEDLFTLEGEMRVRLPTDREVQDAVAKGSGLQSSAIFANEEEDTQDKGKPDAGFTLKRAALEAQRVKDGLQPADSLNLFDRLGLSIEMRRLQDQAADRMSRMLRYEGMFRITIPKDAFERAPVLQNLYPVDSSLGRIPLRVPLEGHLYELTLKQAEDLYQQGRR
jgi:hypothetical protein